MTSEIAIDYKRFAEFEARGCSPLYEEMALNVAASNEIQAFLSDLPVERRQPNLLFAATRFVCGTPNNAQSFEHLLMEHQSEISEIMLQRTTQTNEPGRCACLLPALEQIEGPISLIEVGASAGLCLLPDRYGYDWGSKVLLPETQFDRKPPVFPCTASDNTPLSEKYPLIVWRRGLDLNPLSVTDQDDVTWLETLVWPEDRARLKRLRAAIKVSQRDPAIVEMGDLRHNLPQLIAMAPRDSTVVVFHTAVLNYVSEKEDRNRFAEDMLASDAIWLCNESPRVFPEFSEEAGPSPSKGLFLLSLNGKPIGWTGPHGQSIHWL